MPTRIYLNEILSKHLEDTVRPTYAVTVSSENSAQRDDILQVTLYALELFARGKHAHVFYYLAGDQQKLRHNYKFQQKKKSFYHFHICFRVDGQTWEDSGRTAVTERVLLQKCFHKAQRRSRKKFYNVLPGKLQQSKCLQNDLDAAAKLQYDLRINLDVKAYEYGRKSNFSAYTVLHSDGDDLGFVSLERAKPIKGKQQPIVSTTVFSKKQSDGDLQIGCACPHRKRACNVVEHEIKWDAAKQQHVKCAGKRVCLLSREGKLLPALNSNR